MNVFKLAIKHYKKLAEFKNIVLAVIAVSLLVIAVSQFTQLLNDMRVRRLFRA